MPTIEQLPRASSVGDGDQLAIYSKKGGGTRRAAVSDIAQAVRKVIEGEPDETIYNVSNTVAILPTAPGGNVWAQITLSAAAPALTIILPGPDERAHGQEVLVTCTQDVAALSVNGQNAALRGVPATIAKDGSFRLRYDGISNTWVQIASTLNVTALAGELGAALIGFKLDSPDAILMSLLDALRETISVKRFGAKGDGIKDDAAAIRKALTYAATRCNAGIPTRLCFGGGWYRCNSALGAYTASNLTLDFEGATLDFTDAPVTANGCLSFDGVIGAYTPLTANCVTGSRTATVADTTGFAAGDYVKIVSEGVWDSFNTSARLGEINRVQTGYTVVAGDEITATQLPLATEAQSDYTTAKSAKVAKVTPVRALTFLNGKFIAPAGDNNADTALTVRYGVGVRAVGMTLEGFDNASLFFRNCLEVTVDSCFPRSARPTLTGYGISFGDASSDCTVMGCHFDDVRHSLSTNNSIGSDYGIVRRITFISNTIRNSARAQSGSGGDAIDTHGGADYISIINNTVIGGSGGGINVECPNCIVTGNTIRDTYSYGVNVHNEADTYGSAVVSNNVVERSGGASILVQSGTRGTAFWYRNVIVTGNTVKDTGLSTGMFNTNAGIVVRTSDATKMNRNVVVQGNTVFGTAAEGIVVSGARGGSITGNSVANQTTYGIQVESCVSVAVTGNNINAPAGTTYPGIYANMRSGASVATRLAITGNAIGLVGGSSAKAMVELTNDITNSGVFANVSQGYTGGVVLGTGVGNVAANNI